MEGCICDGLIKNCSESSKHAGLLICLADDGALNRGIAKDQRIFMDDIVCDPGRMGYNLYFPATAE
jgi:hypothetical protein